MTLIVRSAALIVLYLIAMAIPTTDALGIGLLLFLAIVLVSLVWGVIDGRRTPALKALLIWLLVGVVLGVVVTVGTIVVDAELTLSDIGTEIGGTVVFLVVLILVPAALGIGIGRLVRRKDPVAA